jgi:hypothetical protein
LNVIAGMSDANHRNCNCNRRHRNPSSDLIVPLSFQSVILNEFEGNSDGFCIPGTADGFSSSTFYSKCDGQLNTVTIIETTKQFIFGGFTPIA